MYISKSYNWKKWKTNPALYDILMFEFLSVKEHFDMQGVALEEDTSNINKFLQSYNQDIIEHKQDQHPTKSIRGVLFSKDLDYVQMWLDQFSSQKQGRKIYHLGRPITNQRFYIDSGLLSYNKPMYKKATQTKI